MESTGKEGKLGVVASHIRNIKIDKYNAELSLLTHRRQGSIDANYVKRLEDDIRLFSNQIEDLQIQYNFIESE
jgi:hypothetical protein